MVLQDTRRTLESLERLWRSRGYSGPEVRGWLMEKLKIGPGTYRGLRYDEVKAVSAETAFKIQELWKQTVEAEIGRLQHDLQVARQIGTPLSSDEVMAMETLLADAKKNLRGGL